MILGGLKNRSLIGKIFASQFSFCSWNINPWPYKSMKSQHAFFNPKTCFYLFMASSGESEENRKRFTGMNHTISITKIMKLNNFSTKSKKILNLSQNFCNHNYRLAHTAAHPRCWMMKNKRWRTSPAPMIVNPLLKHENEEYSFLFFSLSTMKLGEEEKEEEEEGVIAYPLCHWKM